MISSVLKLNKIKNTSCAENLREWGKTKITRIIYLYIYIYIIYIIYIIYTNKYIYIYIYIYNKNICNKPATKKSYIKSVLV